MIATICWIPRLRHAAREAARRATPSGASSRHIMWTSATAWQVTLFMGFQSSTFFLLITWLPTIETSYGINPAAAGLHLFLLQVAGMIGGIGVTAFMRGRTDQRAVAAAISLLMILAMIGILAVPSLVVGWVIASGLSTGSALVVALTLVAQRARTPRDAGRLSGMVQGVGYLIAAGGPAGAGLLFEATGSWTAPIVMIIAIATAQLIIGLYAGRDRYTHPRISGCARKSVEGPASSRCSIARPTRERIPMTSRPRTQRAPPGDQAPTNFGHDHLSFVAGHPCKDGTSPKALVLASRDFESR